ncbi:MAG: SIS domain-containing protein [Clostridiales bacterium]|nr:SIS domain-containing protein [Clostridiales bacterium]
MKKETLEWVKNAYKTEAECITEMLNYLDEEEFAKAIEILISAERIGTTGCGHSGIIMQHLSHLLCCIDQPAKFVSPAEAVHGGTGYFKKGDAMVFASRGGKTKELLPILDICKKKGVKVISITENLDSPLALGADVVIKQYVNKECDRYNAQGTTSTTSLCMISHAIQTAILEETNFQIEQFAVTHPGGAVGERLNEKALF